MITSNQNPKIKWVRSLQAESRARREAGLFVVEGVRLVEEALAAGWTAQLVLHTEDLNPRGQAVVQGFLAHGAGIEPVSEGAMRAASDTETPQGILAVLEQKELPVSPDLDFVFIPDGIRDPGNLGTMLRSAAAAGVQAVFLPHGTVDPFSPKVLRAGMGAQFRLPVLSLSWQEIQARLGGLPLYLAAVDSGLPYTQANWRAPAAILVGGEAQGAGEQAWAMRQHTHTHPYAGRRGVVECGSSRRHSIIRSRPSKTNYLKKDERKETLKMKIRSITSFLNPHWPLQETAVQQAGAFSAAARRAFEQAGFAVQSTRLATVPFPTLLPELTQANLNSLALQFEKQIQELDFEYVSLGPALPDALQAYGLIPGMLAETQNIFVSGQMTTPGGGVCLPAVRACAEVIQRAAPLTPDGFANLRFTALANVAAGAPFFPAAYHRGEAPAFAIAMQAADLAVDVFSQGGSLEAARRELVRQVEEAAAELAAVAQQLSRRFGTTFNGIDFTLAPFPDLAVSFGAAVERIGAPAAGHHGSLAAAAILADTLDQAQYPRTGFNGLMMPVLEDAGLAERAAQGLLGVKDLLMYSAVCGTGLDTIPLPGDTSAEALQAVLLDLAALSQRLDKPLTARLMPIPGKKAGDPTGFDFAFFANSRVLPLQAEALTGFLAGDETFMLTPRKRNSHLRPCP